MARSLALCLLCCCVVSLVLASNCPPTTWTSCADQVNSGGCCRCATPSSSGWSTSTCAAGNYGGKCIVSCGDSCRSNSNAQVYCDAPCTFKSCDCGAFTLSSITSKLDPNSGTQLYVATFRVCNLCTSDADQVTLGGFSAWGSGTFNGYQSQVANPGTSLWVWNTYSETGFPSAVRFTRTSGQFRNGQCASFSIATSDSGIINPSYKWLVQLSAGGRFEKTINCANGDTQVSSSCLLTTVGSTALTFTTCCDGSVQTGSSPSTACSGHGGVEGTNCKICRGGCFAGGFTTTTVGGTCPTCKTCCDSTSVLSTATCPTCCFDATGRFIAATDPANQCYALCCADGVAVKDPAGDGSVCSTPANACSVCCDGAVYDATSYTQQCNCCEAENGEVRNVAQTGASREQCYYCLSYCGGLGIQACTDAGLMVTAKFTTQIQPNGYITVKAVYSTNYVDNTWGTGAVGWPSTGHRWDHVIGSDKISVDMKAVDGTVVQSFSVDLVAFVGVSTACPSGMCSGCVTKNTDPSIKSDGGWSVGNIADFVDCTTSTEWNCNSACALSLGTNPCSAGASSPTGTNQPATGPCSTADGWIEEYWWEWTVKPDAFLPHGGFSHPIITNIHASPSKFGADNCPVVVPQGPDGSDPYPCGGLGLSTDTTCWKTCCDGSRTSGTCTAVCAGQQQCCDGVWRTTGTCGACCPVGGAYQADSVTDATRCPTLCPGSGTIVQAGQSCPTLCCDEVYRSAAACPVCCLEADYVDFTPGAVCKVRCCDNTLAVDEAACPFCCPDNGPIIPASLCPADGCTSDLCGTECADSCPESCAACGADCACDCRSQFFQYCCPDGDPITTCDDTLTCVTAYPYYVPCNDPTVIDVIGGPDYSIPGRAACTLNCTCGFTDLSCQPVVTVATGCAANTDCQGCNLDPGCVWCPGVGRCTSSCSTGGDLLCGSAVVEAFVPVCYKDCYGNGDCVNNTCVCYDYGYVDQRNVYCAPVVASNSADKAAIGVIVGGTVGLLVLAVLIGGVLIFGTKAALDALNVEDFKNTYMSDNKLYHPNEHSGDNAIYEGGGR